MNARSTRAVAAVRRGKPAESKAKLQTAVDTLPSARHVEVISKFAQLEFCYGSAERGRTVFDGILSSYPKRVDIWSVYIDMELKEGEAEPTKRKHAALGHVATPLTKSARCGHSRLLWPNARAACALTHTARVRSDAACGRAF